MAFFAKRISIEQGIFGKDLRDLRILRGLSISELSKVSGIPSQMISVLEEERLKDLQDPYYAERHVRALAIALEVRPDFLLLKYRKMLEVRGVQRGYGPVLRPMPRKRDFFVTSRVVLIGSMLSIACVIFGYEAWQIRHISAAPNLVVQSPEEGYKTSGSSIAVRGTTETGVFVNVNGQQAVVNPDGHFVSSIRIPSGLTTIRIEARRRYGQTTVVERRVLYERKESAYVSQKNIQ